MIDKKISNLEFATLNYFLTRAFLIGITFNALVNVVKQDTWFIPILGIIPAFIIIFFMDYIMKYKPELTIGEKVISLFKEKVSIIILLLLITTVFFTSILNSFNMNNFIQSQFLNKTPLVFICIILTLIIFYIVNKGINVISRTSNILFYISFALLILSFIGLFPIFKIDNLKPFFNEPLSNYRNGLNNFYTFNILPIFLLTIIPKDCLKSKKIKKTLLISYIIADISIFFILFQTIATFGYELTGLYEYPQFFALKHVILINLSSRVESILIIQLIFDILIYSIFSVYFIGNILKSILNVKNNNIIYFILCIFVFLGTMCIYKYSFYFNDKLINYIASIISIITTIIIIIIYIKIKMSKN